MDNKENYKLLNKQIDIQIVKHLTECQITAGRLGRVGGDKRSTKELVCMHISIINGSKSLGGENIYGSWGRQW